MQKSSKLLRKIGPEQTIIYKNPLTYVEMVLHSNVMIFNKIKNDIEKEERKIIQDILKFTPSF